MPAINITADQIALLGNLPGQIEALVNTTRQTLESIRDGTSDSNPVSVVFQSLSTLAVQAQQLPSLDPLLAPAREVVDALPSRALTDVAQVAQSIESVLNLFGPAKDVLVSGNIQGAFEEGLSRALDAAGRLFQENDEIRTVHRELEEFFRLFRMMLDWPQRPPRPEDVTDLLSRALAGIPPDILEAPFRALENVLEPLGRLLPAGSDLDLWRQAPAARLEFWQSLDARLAEGTIVWPTLEAELRAELQVLLQIEGARDRLLANTLHALGSLRFDGMANVVAALQAIPRIQPTKITPIFDGLRRQLEGMVAEFENWNPTEAEVRAMVRSLVDRLLSALAESPLGQLRTMLIEFQQRLLQGIESLPLRDIARQAENSLRDVANAVDVLDPEAIRQPIREFFQQIEDKLREVSGDTVRNAVAALWQSVEDALNQVSAQVETLRTTLEGLVGELQSFLESVQPALQAISESAVTIRTTLDQFDLSEPAAEVIRNLNELRDTIADLDVSKLPESAVSTLKSGAELLRSIDVAGTVNPAISKELAKIDPTPLLEQATVSLSAVTDQLKLLDPAILTTRLDEPVDQLLKVLSDFGPERFRSLIEEAMKPVEEAVQALDFATLLAPITHLYAELSSKVDAILNPDVLFEPVEKLFQPIVDVIDRIEPSKVIEMLVPQAGPIAEAVGSGAKPPSAIAAAGSLLRDSLPPAPEADDPMLGFRPGDVLLPLIDLHRLLMQTFDSLDDAILEPAGQALQELLRGRLDNLRPPAILLRLETSFENVRLAFDPAASASALTEATLAYRSAAKRIITAAEQSEDADTTARVLELLAELDPLRLAPTPAQGEAVISATLSAEARLDLSGLRASLGILNRLDELIPSFLSGAALTAGSLRDALRALDPDPIRDQINATFDQLGQKLAAVQQQLIAAMEEFFLAVEEFFLPITPAAIVQLANRLHAALQQQVMALHPSVLKDEVRLIFDVVKHQLSILDPSVLVEELNGLRDAAIQSLRDLAGSLVPDSAPFEELLGRLAMLKPSQLLGPLVETLQPISELVATIDPAVLLQPLIEAIARIREQIPDVIASVEAAFDEVLAAFPEGGITGAGVSVSAEVTV
jgi:hypothetical protein